jgi:serine/threonine protein kinase
VLTGKKHNKNVDWWALGCLLFEMCTGITPFHSSTMESLVRKVEKGIVKFPKYMTDDCKDLISQVFLINKCFLTNISKASSSQPKDEDRRRRK